MGLNISTRQFEIINAAGKILTHSGVGGLTIKNLAKEMQFSESAIYRHFSSKEDIIIEMLNFLADDMDNRLASLPNQDNPEQKLKFLFKEQFKFFSANPHFVVAVFSDGLMESSKKINNVILKIMTVKMKYLLPIIKDGQQKNIFTKTIAAEELMHIIAGSFRLQMFKWRLHNFEFDLNKVGNKMINSVLTIIRYH